MALTDSLVAYYQFEEPFDQEIHALNSVSPGINTLGPDTVSGFQLVRAHSVAGVIGNAVYFDADSSYLFGGDAPAFRTGKDKTFVFRFKLSGAPLSWRFMEKNTEYAFVISSATRQLTVVGDFGSFLGHTKVLDLDTWHFLAVWYNFAAGTIHVKFDKDAVQSGPFNSVVTVGGFALGANGATIDELGIWDRILTATEIEELYNNGEGMSYSEIVEDEASKPCRSIECCDDDPAEYVSKGGTGQGFDSNCEPLPRVMFEPTSGTRLIMPSLVALRSDIPGAVIHYTTDGTAPDRNSATYTVPIEVDSPADVIRAIAIVDGCPEGPEGIAQYSQWSPAAHFTYGCGVVDKAGQWGAFAADGNSDYNWQLQIQFDALTGIKRLDVLQLFGDGAFTGAAWSTDEYIYPWEDDATKQHRAFPLVMWNPDDTGAQVNLAYVADFSATYGNFAIGPHVRTLYGAPWTTLPATHLFKLRITFQDGTYIEKVVDSTCDVLPLALCPVPPNPTLTPACGPYRIDVTFNLTVGLNYAIYRWDTGTATLITQGVVASTPETFQDTTVLPGVTYNYILIYQPPGCVAFMASEVVTAMAIPNASVSIAASLTTIGAGQSTTISWNSQNNSGTVSISPTIGAQPGNVPGNQVVSPAATTTYIITGQNACGTITTAQVTVIVEPAATCGTSPPSQLQILGYSDLFFSLNSCGGLLPSSGPVWPGYLLLIDPGNFPNKTCYYSIPDGFSLQGNELLGIEFTRLEIIGGLWWMEVHLHAVGSVQLWFGTKSFGTTPVGVYTRVGGCSNTPATLTLVEISTATCGGAQPGSVAISGYVDNLFVDALTGCPALAVAADPAWDGIMTYRPWVGPCEFLTDYSIYTFIVDGGGRRVLARARVRVVGGVWTLTIEGYQGGDIVVWQGTKSSGDTPLGVYNRTTGCATTPSTITLV